MKARLTALSILMLFRCLSFGILLGSMCLVSCGGGSSGTGTGSSTRLFEGRVLTIQEKPISGATVTVMETGDTAVTNTQGRFAIETVATAGNVNIEIKAQGLVDTTVTVPNLSADSSTVKLDVTVDPLTDAAEVEKFEVVIKIVGLCEQYFDKEQIVHQLKAVPDRMSCILKVVVNKNGKPKAQVPFALQYRQCADGAAWTTIDTEKTLSGANVGVGQIRFTFLDDSDHCVYRVLTPFEVEGVESVEQEIHTLTKQAYDSNTQKESTKELK